MVKSGTETPLGRLELGLADASGRRYPPVETWNPPYCGDIGLAIDRSGTWSYRGSPIRKTALVKLFASVLRRDGDGRHYLVTPVEKVDVAVSDAPFLGVEIECTGADAAQVIIVRTNLDDVMRIGPDHPVRLTTSDDGGLKPYVTVRGRLEALLSRAATFDLAEMIETDAAGRYGISSSGAFYPVEVAS